MRVGAALGGAVGAARFSPGNEVRAARSAGAENAALATHHSALAEAAGFEAKTAQTMRDHHRRLAAHFEQTGDRRQALDHANLAEEHRQAFYTATAAAERHDSLAREFASSSMFQGSRRIAFRAARRTAVGALAGAGAGLLAYGAYHLGHQSAGSVAKSDSSPFPFAVPLAKFKHTAAHPGFQAVAERMAEHQGIPIARAKAELAASTRGAGKGARKRNFRLKRVKG